MRPLSAAQQALYAQGDFAMHVRVLVDGTGSLGWVDLANHMGRNWIISIDLSDSVDSPMLQGSVVLQRDVFNLSINPFRYNSKLNQGVPLINVGRRVRVYVAATPIDAVPLIDPGILVAGRVGGEFNLVGDCVIEELDTAGPTCNLTVRDFVGSVVQNCFIRADTKYGSPAGTAVASVMQSIINDHINAENAGLGIVLKTDATPVPPSFLVTPYLQEKQTVQDALTKLAQQLGWLVKPRYDPDAYGPGQEGFALTLFQPQRSNTTPSWAFTADSYMDISSLAISRAGIRNCIAGVYMDPITQVRNTVIVRDEPSIAKYGPPVMYMELSEDASGGINTKANMTTMLNAILADLKEPQASITANMFALWWIEVNDIVTFKANNRHFDTDINLAVVGYSTSISATEAKTQLTLRGTPSGGYRRWLRLEGRVGVASTNRVADPTGPSAPITVPGVGSIDVYVDYPADIEEWFTTEVYMSLQPFQSQTLVNGKYQRPSAQYLVAAGRQVRFSLTGLLIGALYYIQSCYIDRSQNVSSVSQTTQQATEAMGPYHQTTDGRNDNMVFNNDVNIFTKGKILPPDRWTLGATVPNKIDADPNHVSTTTWGVNKGQTFWTLESAQTGNLAVMFNADLVAGKWGSGAIRSDIVPITAQGAYRYNVVAAMKNVTVPTANAGTIFYMIYGLEFFDVNKNLTRNTLSQVVLRTSADPDTAGNISWKSSGATIAVTDADRYVRGIVFPQQFTLFNNAVSQDPTKRVPFIAYLDKFSISPIGASLNIRAETFSPGRSVAINNRPVWLEFLTAIDKPYIGFRLQDSSGNGAPLSHGELTAVKCFISGVYSISAHINVSYQASGVSPVLNTLNAVLYAAYAGTVRALGSASFNDSGVTAGASVDAGYGQFYALNIDVEDVTVEAGTSFYVLTQFSASNSSGIPPAAIYSNIKPCTLTLLQTGKDQ